MRWLMAQCRTVPPNVLWRFSRLGSVLIYAVHRARANSSLSVQMAENSGVSLRLFRAERRSLASLRM